MIAVSSVDSGNRISSFSSYGSEIELAAPGENILSTYRDAYVRSSGTSMAAAHVSGAAALAKALHNLGGEELRSFLHSATVDLGSPGKDEYYGYGLIDAGRINMSAGASSSNVTAPKENVSSQTAIQTLRTYYATIGPFPEGRVFYKVAAQDSSGNSVVEDNRGRNYEIVVDTTPPTGSVTINSGAAYTGSASATLSLTCSDASGCAEMQFSNDGIAYSVPEVYAVVKSWILAGGDGTKTVYAKFKDGAGNWAAPVSDTIVLDTTPPVTTDNAPLGWQRTDFTVTLAASDALSGVSHTSYRVDGGAWANGTSISITAEGNHTIEYYSVDTVGNAEAVKRTYAALDKTPPVITITGIENGKYYNMDVIASVTFFDANLNVTSITLDGIQYTSGTLISIEGAHILEAFASDLAGNAAYANVSFVIDKTAPTVQIISPANGSYVGGVVAINGSASDANLANVSISINGSVVSNATSYTWDTTRILDGSYEIRLTATDKAANSASVSVIVTVDNTPPSVSILQPANNSYIASKNVAVLWNASDNTGIAGYELLLNEISLANTTETTKTLENLTEGLHSVEVKAFDLANNLASAFVSFTIDTIPPSITITGVANGSYYNTDVSANVSIYDANPKSASILLDGATYASGSVISSEGIHVLQLYADDLAGNVAFANLTFTIDKTPPGVNITSPINGSFARRIVEITGSVADINLERVSLSVDGREVAGALPYSWNTANYSDGMHVIELKAIDRANNSASASVSVIVDNMPPNITITSPLAQNYSYTRNITIDFSVTDTASGVASFRAHLDGSEVASGQFIDLFNFTLGEHNLTVETSDNVGNNATATITFKVIDNVPPISSDNADKEWHNSDIVVTITARDEKSSVREIHYAVNEGQEVIVNGSVANATITYEHDNNTIRYYAVDGWGNAEAQKLVDGIKLDKTLPVVKLWLEPMKEEYFSDELVQVKYEAYDPKVQGNPSNNLTLTFYIDGIIVDDPTNIASLVGTHTLTLTAKDRAGNKASASVNFTVILRAEINIDPDTLNLKSEGKWITAYIEFPSQYDVMSIKINTLTLNRTIKAENDPKYDFVSAPQPQDKDGDGLKEFMVKFDMSAVEAILQPVDAVTLSVRGEFAGGIFEGYDTIRVIEKGNASKANKTVLKLNKHLDKKEGRQNQVRVRIDLFTTGNSQVSAVLVEEYIPRGLGADTMTGIFVPYGLLWEIEKIEQGKKQAVEYTLLIPKVEVTTTYELRTVVEYQTAEDVEMLEEITYLTVEPDGQAKLKEGQSKSAVKEKGRGYTKEQRGSTYSKGGGSSSGGGGGKSEEHRQDDKAHEKEKGKPDSPPGQDKNKDKGKK